MKSECLGNKCVNQECLVFSCFHDEEMAVVS